MSFSDLIFSLVRTLWEMSQPSLCGTRQEEGFCCSRKHWKGAPAELWILGVCLGHGGVGSPGDERAMDPEQMGEESWLLEKGSVRSSGFVLRDFEKSETQSCVPTPL